MRTNAYDFVRSKHPSFWGDLISVPSSGSAARQNRKPSFNKINIRYLGQNVQLSCVTGRHWRGPPRMSDLARKLKSNSWKAGQSGNLPVFYLPESHQLAIAAGRLGQPRSRHLGHGTLGRPS